jgi:hypothetical protein
LLCFHAVPSFCGISVLRVICVARMDVGVVLLSFLLCAVFVCVCLYTVGLVECIMLLLLLLSSSSLLLLLKGARGSVDR